MIWKQGDLAGDKQDPISEDITVDKSQLNDSDANEESRQDIDFVYDDTDEYTTEIAEIYSYTEEDEFSENKTYFYEEFNKIFGQNVKWIDLNDTVRKGHINRLCGLLDSGKKDVRNKAARSLLYIFQGVFGECELEEDQVIWTRHNIFLSLECGILSVIVDLLLFEIKYEEWQENGGNNDPKQNNGLDGNVKSSRKQSSSPGSSIGANPELRVVLNLLYVIIETVRSYKCKHKDNNEEGKENKQVFNWMRLADNLIDELNEGIASLGTVENAPNLMIVLFGMIHRFCSGLAPSFPMKKVLLVLWKTALLIMGPITGLFEMKNMKRKKMDLSPLTEDTHKVVRFMKASNFPSSNADFLEIAQPLTKSRPRTRLALSNHGPSQGSFAEGRGKLLATSSVGGGAGESVANDCVSDDNGGIGVGDSSSLDDEEDTVHARSFNDTLIMDESGNTNDGLGDDPNLEANQEDSLFDVDEDTMDDIPQKSSSIQKPNLVMDRSDGVEDNEMNKIELGMVTPRPSSPTNELGGARSATPMDKLNHFIGASAGPGGLSTPLHDYKTLPWKPKVKSRDLETFMETVRAKFIGYPISGQDSVTLAGLPLPIQDAIQVLKSHLYISIGEIQVKAENDIIQYPLSIGSKEVIEETPAEKLYRNMLPLIPQYMIALLKILLAAAPTSKSKTESINILAEIVPDEIPTTITQSLKLNYDINRHKEIIVKAISGLLLLLLKHFKLNHIYQFEYVSQHLVFANCIPLVLKFFNQNILNYVQAKNSIPSIDFPSCVIGEKMELNTESLEINDHSSYCWRNVFSCINLLRILNMLTKWKHSRTMMMVVFKSPPILKRALKVRQAMLQLYVLKLLKSQTRYSGRQWRKTNMQIMSAIYQKVRHRLTDDWAYGNDVDARPWDFQAEECGLRTSVTRFNNRRYFGEQLDCEYSKSVRHRGDVLGLLAQRAAVDVVLPRDFRDNYERWLENEVYSVSINWDQVLAR